MWTRALPLVTGLLCVLHVGAVLRHYPLTALWNEHPLVSGDLPLHFSAAHVGRQALDAGGDLWGYAVDFMAGYPFGAWDSFTQRGYEYCSLLFPGLSLVGAFHGYLLVTALLPPLLIGAAAWVLGGGRRLTMLSLCVAVLVYQMDDTTAYFWTFGNMGFPFVNALGVLYLACLARGLRDVRPVWLLAAGLLLAAVGWLHQMAALPVAAGSLCVLLALGRDLLRRRRLAWALLVPALAAALLLPWLAVLWHFREFRVPRETPALAAGIKSLIMDFLSDRAYRHHFDRRTLFHVQFVLAAIGAWTAWRGSRRSVTALWAAGMASLAFAYLFSYSSFLRETEPYRFVVSFALLAAIPAAAGAARLAELFREAERGARAAAVLLGLILAPSLTAYGFDILGRDRVEPPGVSSRATLEWFRNQDPSTGRVLCLDSTLGDLLPYYGGHAVLGGGMTRVSPLPHKAAWAEGYRLLMEPPGGTPSAAAVAEYLTRYNVAYVLVPNERLEALMTRIPGASLKFQSGRGRVYGICRERLSYVVGWEGDAAVSVEAGMNRITVRGAPAGRFVLKFHYQDTLRAPPGVRLYPAPQPGDPVPFLGVENGAGLSEVRIINGRLVVGVRQR